jgi:parallel beta-helix repeat protein
VTNCTFSGNASLNTGGGMQNNSSLPMVTNCTFSGNTAYTKGGGMYNTGSSPTVTNCTFSGNTASAGAGMCNDQSSSPTVTNCTFSINTASGIGGGGMLNTSSSSPAVVNSIFYKNIAFPNGKNMYNSSSPTVTNCTFLSVVIGSMYNSGPVSPIVTNCIFWGNWIDLIDNVAGASPIVTYCDIQYFQPSLVYPGVGNINADPMFVDVSNGNLHLKAFSPCIDAGNNAATPMHLTDIDGDDRRIDDTGVIDTGSGTTPIVDMGADERGQKSEKGDINCDGQIDIADAILALKICASMPPASAINTGPDVNADSKIGIEEVTYVLHKVSTLRE